MTEPTPLLFDLDPGRRAPLHRQLYDQLRDAILRGKLKPGERIPSTRTLAEELDLSRTTVLTAVRRLRVEGFLEARVGAGTWVSENLEEELRGRRRRREEKRHDGPAREMSRRSQRLCRLVEDVPPPTQRRRPFQVGVPALAAETGATWARIAGRHWRRAEGSDLTYASRAGERVLREAIAEYVGLSRGVSGSADRVLVTSGSQIGLLLTALVLLDAGDAAWFEEPGYGGARGALFAAGARPVPVPVDRRGLAVETGRALAEDARLAYVTPSHQFPLGVTLDLERRLSLLRWAEERGSWIVEDDYDSEYRYEGRPLLSLQGLDGAGRVIYVGTFSKTLFPGLRLGFLVVPEDLVEAFTATRYFVDHHPPVPHQWALADFIAGGDLARHIRRMRGRYGERRGALLEGLRTRFGGLLEPISSESGLHLTALFRSEVDDRALEVAAAARGLGVLALSPFYGDVEAESGLVFGFGGTPTDEIEPGLDTLARALEEVGAG